MEPGASSSLLTIILGSLILQLPPGTPEVIHFGPLFIREKQSTNVTKYASFTEEAFEVFPQTVPLEEALAETSTDHLLLEPVSSMAATDTVWWSSSQPSLEEEEFNPFPTLGAWSSTSHLMESLSSMAATDSIWWASNQDEFSPIPALSAQPSTSPTASETIYISVNPTESLSSSETGYISENPSKSKDVNNLNWDILESSISDQPMTTSVPLEASLRASDQYVTASVEYFSSILPSGWRTQNLPMPSSEVITHLSVEESLGVESSLTSEPYTTSYYDSKMASTPIISLYTPIMSSMQWAPYTPDILESTVEIQSMPTSEEVTSISTKNLLESIFSSLGLFSTQVSSMSPSVTDSITSSLDTSAEWPGSSSLDVSESLPLSLENTLTVSPVPATLPHSGEISRPSYTVSSEITLTPWPSEDYLESLTVLASSVEEKVQTNVVSDSLFPFESTEAIESVFPSSTLVPSSLAFTDLLESSMEFSSLDKSVTTMSTMTLDLDTRLVSADSTVLMPSLLTSSVSTIDFDILESLMTTSALQSTFSWDTSHISASLSTSEAAAFVPTESGMYFTQTLFPSLEPENISDLATSLFSVFPTSKSFPEDVSASFSVVSSDVSAFISQDSSSVFPTHEFSYFPEDLSASFSESVISQNSSSMFPTQEFSFFPGDLSASFSVSVVSQDSSSVFPELETLSSSYVLETLSPSVTDTIGMEFTSWETIRPTSAVSFTPMSSSDWMERSVSSIDLWEITSTPLSESGMFFTSTFSGATSTPWPSSSELAATVTAFFTSFDFDSTSSALIEGTLQTSLASSVPITSVIPTSMWVRDSSETYTSVISTTYFISQTLELSSSPSVSLLPTVIMTPSLSLLSTVSSPYLWTTPSSLSSSISASSSSLQLSTSLVPTTIPPPLPSMTPSSTVLIPVVTTTSAPTISTHTQRPSTTSATSTSTGHESTTTRATTSSTAKPETTTSTTSMPITPPSGLTATSSPTTTRPTRVCDVSNPDPYLVTAVLSRGSNIQNITDSIKEFLTLSFSRPVEIEVYMMSQRYSFMVTSGPFVYTAFAVADALSRSPLVLAPFPAVLSVQSALLGLEPRFRVQTVLQFVPLSVDLRLCTFSEQIQRGLSLALYEVRQLRPESDNLTVQIVNISTSLPRVWKAPVTVSYSVRDRAGFLNGSEISDQLRNLSLVEFSYFLGYPVKQIAEPSQYPQLNVSPSLKDSWLQTVLLDVQEQHLKEEAFPTEMERKLAQLISEALQKRRWKRASNAGSNTVQVVSISRINGSDDPVELIYFIEDQYGGRLAADKASSLINEVNIQRAAIILGYRLQGVVAQPLNRPLEPDQQAQNLWIIVGVAVPVLVVTIIIVILYWKLCRTDKLDFQPDTISNLQQRQKLQAPNVKGFDFAKQHLGQHNKDDILVVHEPPPPPPPPLHGPLKDSTPSENGDIPTPKSKSSTKPSKLGRHRSSRVTPSEAGSTASEPSSGRESGEETSARPSAPPCETPRRPTTKAEMPVLSGGPEKHSSASIFDHVDRMSRSSEASRRLPSKLQLIAMQPMATPPLRGMSAAEREMEANKINREIQTTLRHKSEIEHHRNKIRLRAKRKGHYEFPLVDVVGMVDTKERQRVYRRAQMQFDKILDPAVGVPSVFIEPRKSSRARRSPKQRRRQQGSSSPPDADRDRLIATDSDGTYKRPPGVSNSAYVSDPDLPSDNPTPVSDPGSPPRAPLPTQYVAPQPSIEEVRQTMQSLLDDAFALVAPSSQGPAAVLSGGNQQQQPTGTTSSSHTGPRPTAWGAPYPAHQTPHYSRFVDFGVTGAPPPSMMTRSPGFPSGFFPPSEPVPAETQQAEGQYPARMYPEDLPLTSVARPRPLGSNSGSTQIHQLTQVGIASRMGVQSSDLASNNRNPAPPGLPNWPSYYSREEENQRNPPAHPHSVQDYGAPQMYGVSRAPARQPATHLPPAITYPPASAEDIHPGHSSASLIKAIREELLRLSQKHVVAPTYHS